MASEYGIRPEAAVGYLLASARPLEAARFRYRFVSGERSRVIGELMAFRNADGGFGNALEPDMRSPSSSVLATVEALDVMAEVGLPVDDPVNTAAVEWLAGPGYDPGLGLWPYLKPGMEDAPHAPWWDMENLAETFGGFRLNPRARVAGHLFRSPVGRKAAVPHLEAILADASVFPDAVTPDTLRSLLTLYDGVLDGGSGFETEARELEKHIRRMIPASVETDPAKWGEYCLQPLEVADEPDSPWMDLLGDAVGGHLDYLEDKQQPDGSWAPFWSWGDRYPEDWKQAVQEWKGVLTFRNLCRLHAFGRIQAGFVS